MVISWAIKLVLGLIFFGYLMIWALMPTNLWRQNWVLELSARTDSKYFGLQGAYMLTFTFPVLFIAVVACFYLHLRKNINRGSYPTKGAERINHLARWRKPMLTKGPLGVVSALELAFLFLFLALLLWFYCTRLTIRFREIEKGVMASHHHHRRNGPKWVQRLRTSGFNLGVVGNICSAFLFYPVARGSSILPLVGLTSEGSIKYHIWLGHITMALFTAHGLIYFLCWLIIDDLGQIIKWDNTGVSNVAGEIALMFGLVLWVTVIPRFRRKKFELFFYTHQLYVFFMFFYMLHVGIIVFFLLLPGFYLFFIDRYLRFLQSRRKVRLVSARLLPCETLELNFSKSPGLNYNPTSIVFINVPCISTLQWHPFTVSSNGNLEHDVLSVMIKKEGSWTAKLYETLAFPSPDNRLEASLEGPYGPVSADFLRYDSLVMVAGGSGITPMISIIRELIFRRASVLLNPPIPCNNISLICAFKHSSDLAMLELVLPGASTSTTVPIDMARVLELIEVKAFVTRETGPSTADETDRVRTIWFKPNQTDVPVSAVLGPQYAWLFLAAIISTSFAIFLIVMGIIGRYYIYPIDKNTNEVFSSSARAVLNMLVLCLVTIGIASIAALWNKRRINGRESKEKLMNNTDVVPTSTTGLIPSVYDADKELEMESLPYRSIVQNTKVHFGARPDLKKMLREFEGTSTGVLVSGPKEMRHEVAAICSSSTSGNLHYEAISFNW